VKTLADEFLRRDEEGTLADLFAPATADETVVGEEGWILGA
jgi:hypothetical protein